MKSWIKMFFLVAPTFLLLIQVGLNLWDRHKESQYLKKEEEYYNYVKGKLPMEMSDPNLHLVPKNGHRRK